MAWRLCSPLMLNRRLPEARTLFDEAIGLGDRDSSIPRVRLAQAMGHRAIMLQNEGKRDQAETMYRKALAIGRQEDPNGFWQTSVLFGLATVIARPCQNTRLRRQVNFQILATISRAGKASAAKSAKTDPLGGKSAHKAAGGQPERAQKRPAA